MLSEISNLKMRDLEVFREVVRARSIREVARRLNSTPGQVSKTVQNLERLFGHKLFRRSVSGVLLTSQGTELDSLVSEMLEHGEKLEQLASGRAKPKAARVLAVAGTSFLNTYLSTPTLCRHAKEMGEVGFRFLDLAPDQLTWVGLRGGFEIAVHFGAPTWPQTWVTRRLGKVRWCLYARHDHPLAKRPTLKQVLTFPFVVPTYWTSEGLVRGNDQFPIAISKRKIGFETATADAAVPIVLETDQLACLPEILARSFGRLREVHIESVPVVERELSLSVKADAVSMKVLEVIAQRLSEAILN